MNLHCGCFGHDRIVVGSTTDCHDILSNCNIVESGIKHHNTNHPPVHYHALQKLPSYNMTIPHL